MIHLSLNLPSGTAARAAARRAKRLYPFAGSLLRGGGGEAWHQTAPPPPRSSKTTVIIAVVGGWGGGGWNPLSLSEPLKMFLEVLGGRGRDRPAAAALTRLHVTRATFQGLF